MSRARDLADLGGSANAGTITGESLIINGDMAVWQRGTTDDTASVGDFMCDRWQIAFGGLDGNVDWDKETSSTPDGFSCAVKVSTDAAEASLDADDYIRITQKFEGQFLQHLQKGSANAKKITLSFWVKSSVASTYTVELEDRDTASFRHIAKSYTVDTANTWEYKTITFDGDTTGALDNDNDNSLNMHFWIDAGSTYSGGTFPAVWQARTTNQRVYDPTGWLEDTTSREFYLTGVKLEVGSTATPFKHESYADNLRKCQRYYQQYLNPNLRGTANTTSRAARLGMQLPITMRATPTVTITQTGSSGHFEVYDGVVSKGYSSVQASYLGKNKIEFDINVVGTDLTVGNATCVYNSDTVQSSFGISAEL